MPEHKTPKTHKDKKVETPRKNTEGAATTTTTTTERKIKIPRRKLTADNTTVQNTQSTLLSAPVWDSGDEAGKSSSDEDRARSAGRSAKRGKIVTVRSDAGATSSARSPSPRKKDPAAAPAPGEAKPVRRTTAPPSNTARRSGTAGKTAGLRRTATMSSATMAANQFISDVQVAKKTEQPVEVKPPVARPEPRPRAASPSAPLKAGRVGKTGGSVSRASSRGRNDKLAPSPARVQKPDRSQLGTSISHSKHPQGDPMDVEVQPRYTIPMEIDSPSDDEKDPIARLAKRVDSMGIDCSEEESEKKKEEVRRKNEEEQKKMIIRQARKKARNLEPKIVKALNDVSKR